MGQVQEEEQTRLNKVNMLDWSRVLAGCAAVCVVFLATALWVILHYGASNGALGLGLIVAYTLRNPVFWVLSVAVFRVTYRIAA